MITQYTRGLACLCLILFGAIAVAAQSKGPDAMLGTWSGTWESAGSGAGGFELTLEKSDAGTLGGKVAVTGEPAYTAPFTSVSFDGNKMTAKYDFPADERAEVLLTATFDGKAAKGTWSLREKSTSTEAVSGTFAVARK